MNKKDEDNIDVINAWEEYKVECLNCLDKVDKLDKKIVYEEFLKIYNTKSYNFTYDKQKMINFYNSWKKIY